MTPTSVNTIDEATSSRKLVGPHDPILVTGGNGFIGSRLVAYLLQSGFRNIRCFSRSARPSPRLAGRHPEGARLEWFAGNLLSRDDCAAATKDIAAVFHLAAGRGSKSFPDAFMNSVVTTRNLLDACLGQGSLRRFVSVSSFAVYSNQNKHSKLLNELCPIESRPELRGDAYSYAKCRQDDLVAEYGRTRGLPYVIVRPGYVYGPGKHAISGRVGISPFGLFLHLGGGNTLPLTYVDNCAEAIALAGIIPGINGETFNIVDDDLPSSRRFLRLYKRNVGKLRSIYLPHGVSYLFCCLWERYSAWSQSQLPPVYNRRLWHASWKRTTYSNAKAKTLLGWTPKVSTEDGLAQYFAACRSEAEYA
jgi:nucleoside-diphosphate-sugar epimerase